MQIFFLHKKLKKNEFRFRIEQFYVLKTSRQLVILPGALDAPELTDQLVVRELADLRLVGTAVVSVGAPVRQQVNQAVGDVRNTTVPGGQGSFAERTMARHGEAAATHDVSVSENQRLVRLARFNNEILILLVLPAARYWR